MARGDSMKAATIIGLAMVVITAAQPSPVRAQRSSAPEVLTNDWVIQMSAANLNRDVMLAKINSTRNTFDVTAQGLINLTANKVNENVIKSMISAAANPKLGPPAPKTPEVLDNQAIISMYSSKVSRAVIIAKIVATKANFDTTSAGLVSLTQAKVPSDI